MRLVVADTSPVFYLLTIGHIDLLPSLFGKVVIPDAMQKELKHPTAPQVLRAWSVPARSNGIFATGQAYLIC